MALKFYNTLTRKLEEFEEIEDGIVKMYSCGPTVYNYVHIGNLRCYIFNDILKRYLKSKCYDVIHVMNITDVDDKTIRDSKKEGVTLKEFTEKYTKAFLEDLKTLNIETADIMPKATDYIKEMVDIVKDLEKKGLAYKKDGSYYFAINKFKEYGKLSKINSSNLKKNADGRLNEADEYDKDDARDFALWKAWDANDGDVFWETDIGKGRPGWHIECSAMSMKNLGETFDIHTGGIDLIFPHHENEIAQSEGCTGKPFVKYWIHNDHLLVNNEKMSKSLGNFYTLRQLLERGFSPRAIRYELMSTNYRQKLNFTFDGVKAAEKSIEKMDVFMKNLHAVELEESDDETVNDVGEHIAMLLEGFEEAMDFDLNISKALASVFEFITAINKILNEGKISIDLAEDIISVMKKIDEVLGILKDDYDTKDVIPEAVLKLIAERDAARQNKDWAKSDVIRDKINKLGYKVLDKSGKTIVEKE